MNTIISAQQMKELDSKTISEFGIPSAVLMENAGKGCADLMRDLFEVELNQGIVILCGAGNNGGDGYVIARWLDNYGFDVTIISAGESNSSPETINNRDLCKKLYIEIINITDPEYKTLSEEVLYDAGVIVDCLFGIGFKGNLNEQISTLIERVNSIEALKVAIDIPSGVSADTGYAELAFKADITLTMETMKYGHLIGKGRFYSNLVEVIPIGIPEYIWEDMEVAILLNEITAHLPDRKGLANKGDYGRIAVFAGSPGFTGAAFMSALACVKAGAGLVTLFSHPDNTQIYDNKPYEVMVREIPLDAKGLINSAALQEALDKYDVILFGPGCGVNDFSLNTLNFILNDWNKSAIIDADGLNTLAQHPKLYKLLAEKSIILTPHWGEYCRLADTTIEALQQDCINNLRQFVQQHKVKVLLKSATSVYYDTDIMYINITGNDGLSTGGSGDVLSGLIAGFLGQKMSPANAAGMAAYYLGLTAELLAEKQETLSILPTDILDNIFKYETDEDYTYETE
jgi:NAD(P)H-hydrate epimerase